MSLTKIQKAGIFIIYVGIVAGAAGTSWKVYTSFARLETAESGGLGPVGDALRDALFFSAGGIVVVIGGAILLILGRSKR